MKQSKDRFHIMSFCLGILLIVFIVQAGGSLQGNRIVFPDTKEIGKAFLRLLGQGKTYTAIGVTMLHLIEALISSLIIGTILGLMEGMSSRIRSALLPIMTLVRSLPMIVIVILIMTVFPYEHVPVIAAGLILTPLISEAVSEGVRAVDPELKDVYRLNSGFNGTVLFHVYIPLVSGYLKQAFFNAAGMGLKVTVSAEYLVQTRNSLGRSVYSSSYFLEYAEIYAYALIMILLVLLITELPIWLFSKIEKNKAERFC